MMESTAPLSVIRTCPGDWFYLAVQEATNSHDYKDRGGEVWTKLTRDPDWTRYER